jgi:DNA-binding transcriptional LysR family regulator
LSAIKEQKMDRLSGILAFVRAAESRSFAQAARVLDVTPSGVGKSISRLETELGVRLLNRTTRRVSLTDDGAVFFEHCRRILDDLDTAESLMSNRRAAPRGRLHVSLPTTLGKLFVIPYLPRFLERHPELTLELSMSDRRVNLVEDGIDIAVRIGTLNDSTLIARPLWQQQVITIASPRYIRGQPIGTMGDLALHRCLMFRWPTTGRERPWLFHIDGRNIDWRPRIFVTIDEGEALVEAARAGVGITQVPSYMAETAIKRNEVVELLPEIRPSPDPINAIYASQRNLPARIRAFIDFLTTLPGPRHTSQPQPAPLRGKQRIGKN